MTSSTPKALVFDAYGTLFDVQSVVALAETLAPQQGAALSQLWRTKQLEYTWLQSLMATPKLPRENFSAVTAHALDYALSALLIPLGAEDRRRLLDAYLELTPFPDAREEYDAGTLPSSLGYDNSPRLPCGRGLYFL